MTLLNAINIISSFKSSKTIILLIFNTSLLLITLFITIFIITSDFFIIEIDIVIMTLSLSIN